MKNRPSHQRDPGHIETVVWCPNQMGLTLIEMMIAMGIGLSLLGGILGVMAHWGTVDHSLLHKGRLGMDAGSVMSFMSRELHHAGYWSESADHPDQVNPFLGVSNPETSCVLFGYDRGRRNALGSPWKSGLFGFRLRNGVIQYRAGKASCKFRHCNNCDQGRWWALTDPGTMNVDSMVVSTAYGGAAQQVSSGGLLHIRLTVSGKGLKPVTLTRHLSMIIPVALVGD